MRKILFVCTGNICRSPSAEAVFGHLAGPNEAFCIDSAGTHGYHVGEPSDRRAISSARARGVDMADLRARKVDLADFRGFDLILAMDRGHLDLLKVKAPAASNAEIKLFSDFSASLKGQDIPDPYYGDARDFERMLDMIWTGCTDILAKIEQT